MNLKKMAIPFLIYSGIFAILPLCACQQKMAREGRVRSFAPNSFFSNGSSARHPVEGTVSRGSFNPDSVYLEGKKNGTFIQEVPILVTRPILERGRERYNIYCSPCHGYTGDGQGMIVKRGFSAPPSYHMDRLRSAPAGHFYDVISHGYGAMYSYGDRVLPTDRWAITAYIRALQKSQHVRFSELPTPLQERLKAEVNPGENDK